jgi:PIN domain nuclease of toxin-antitoxin system
MRLLLDTHIWLWSRLEPERLSRRVARELLNPENELWLSPVSAWEVLLLSEKGRIVLDGGAGAWIEKAMSTVPLREAPFTRIRRSDEPLTPLPAPAAAHDVR